MTTHATGAPARAAPPARERLRLAVIGAAGLMAQYVYLPLLRRHRDIRLAALCDVDRLAVEEVAAGAGVQWSADAGEVIQDPDVDAVAILTPPWGHHDLVEAALRAGKHVYVEKPLALDPAVASSLADLAERRRRRLVVGYMKRFDPLFGAFRAEVDRMPCIEGAEVISVAGSWGGEQARRSVVPPGVRSGAPPRLGVPDWVPGGAERLFFWLASKFVHDLDLAVHVFGAPGSIAFARAAEDEHGLIFEARLLTRECPVDLRFISPADRGVEWCERIVVRGERDAVTLDLPAPLVGGSPSRLTIDREGRTAERTEPNDLAAFAEQVDRFVRCVRRPAMADGSARSAAVHLKLAGVLTRACAPAEPAPAGPGPDDSRLRGLFDLESTRRRRYPVRMVAGLAHGRAGELAGLLQGRRALLVTTPTVADRYGETIECLGAAAPDGLEWMVLTCREASKSMAAVERVCSRAIAMGLSRADTMISLGGGVCMDVVTMASSLFRRGVDNIRIPTTLIGQVDAGLGLKGAVNHDGKKSALGCFSPPRAVVIDTDFLGTLPAAQVRDGLAEMVKIAITCDGHLFDLLEAHHGELLRTALRAPAGVVAEVVERAARDMLAELATNPYEDQTFERLVDMGHTFSPLLESATGFALRHGEAVAVDLAISATLASDLGVLARADRDRIVALLRSIGLPTWSEAATPARCGDALTEAARHRGGSPNLVIPERIGGARFVRSASDVPPEVVRRSLDALQAEALTWC
jgi:2-epi-5-epi-valiolone synthase